MNFSRFLFVFALFCTFSNLKAQTKVHSILSKNVIEIADTTHLTLEVETSENTKINFPIFNDTISNLVEMVGKPKIDTLKKNGKIILRQHFLISVYTDTVCNIPPLKVIVNQRDTIFSNSLSLQVLPVNIDKNTAAKIDTTKELKIFPVKPNENTPLTLKEFFQRFYWVFIILFLLLAGILFWKRWKNRKIPVVEKIFEKPKEAPHIIAFRSLDSLLQKKLWQQGKIKEFHIELTEILRIYIEQRYEVAALEQTTEEIIETFNNQRITQSENIELLQKVLFLADLVKFAKYSPLPDDNDRCFQQSYAFVDKTKQISVSNKEVSQ